MGSRVRWVVALLMTVAACGGDGSTVVDASGDNGQTTSPALAAEALIDQWGSDRSAFYVVAWSLDAGYSAGQIMDAAPHDRIRADGSISDAGGARLEPVNEPAGLLIAASGEAHSPAVVVAAAIPGRNAAMLVFADADPQDAQVAGIGRLSDIHDAAPAAHGSRMEKLKADEPLTPFEKLATEQVEEITRVTIELGARGYSAGQILDAILRGNYVQFIHTEEPPGGCWYVLAGKGGWGADLVTPEDAPVDHIHELECAHAMEVIEDVWVPLSSTTSAPSSTTTATTSTTSAATTTTTTTEAPLTFPRTYAGNGMHTFSTSVFTGTCVTEGHQLEVTLLPDGEVAASWVTWGQSYSSSGAPEGEKPPIVCLETTDQVTLELEGWYESGHVFIHASDDSSDIVLEGDFTAETLEIDHVREIRPFDNDVLNWLEYAYLLGYQDG